MTPLYKKAEPNQHRKHCGNYYTAKFWREAQDKPTDWVITPNHTVVRRPLARGNA